MNNESEWYSIIGVILGIITFIGIWIYSISEWGILLGLAVGWIPAIIGGVIIGWTWPVIAIIIFILYSLSNH